WTMGYDTIYAIQDLEDDAVAGIRSTALLFGQRTQMAVSGFYAVTVVCVALAFQYAGAGPPAYLGLILFSSHLARQCLRIDIGDGQGALALFRSNRNAGLILFAGLIADGVARNLFAG
ncbi:MAG: UbiA family prenyltransferase, partial [Dolichospermum sp.]